MLTKPDYEIMYKAQEADLTALRNRLAALESAQADNLAEIERLRAGKERAEEELSSHVGKQALKAFIKQAMATAGERDTLQASLTASEALSERRRVALEKARTAAEIDSIETVEAMRDTFKEFPLDVEFLDQPTDRARAALEILKALGDLPVEDSRALSGVLRKAAVNAVEKFKLFHNSDPSTDYYPDLKDSMSELSAALSATPSTAPIEKEVDHE